MLPKSEGLLRFFLKPWILKIMKNFLLSLVHTIYNTKQIDSTNKIYVTQKWPKNVFFKFSTWFQRLIFTKFQFSRFDASWESMGCHESAQGDTTLIRCTCETNYCNAENAQWMQKKVVSSDASKFGIHLSKTIQFLPIFILVIYGHL